MPFLFKLPDVGEGINEGEVVSWFVKEGDLIQEDQPLLELQNDKLLQEIPSPVTGKITKILIPAGTAATVGEGLVEFELAGDVPSIKESEVKTNDGIAIAASNQKLETNDHVRYPNNSIAGRILAMPSVRQYARDHQVDLTTVKATGRHGHVTKNDVNLAMQSDSSTSQNLVKEPEAVIETTLSINTSQDKVTVTPTSSATPVIEVSSSQANETVVRERFSITRKAIAKAMMTSQSNTASVAVFDEVEVSKLIAHRDRFKSIAQNQGTKLTYLPYIVKALIAVARKYPVLNASVDDQKEEIIYKKDYHIGIAVDTDQGLYVPNIKNADTKGIFSIANEISELTASAKDGKLAGLDMRGGTMTITNIGSVGGLWFTPIINYPEVIILGVGRIVSKPIVMEDGSIGVGNMLALSLSFDHRIIDGKTAQLAMNEVKRLLADPELLLMEG